jgi:uncharacterized protein (TIGR03546 family)
MTPLKLIRSLGKMVRGGADPLQIFLGCLLGVLIGMVPGVNAILVLFIFLFVILNANVGLTVLGFGLGKGLSLLAAKYTFDIGYRLMRETELAESFPKLLALPGMAWTDLHVYCLLGGLPVALVVGGLMGIVVTIVIVSLRKGIAKATEKSETVKGLAANKFVRLMMRFLFGKAQPKPAEGEDDEKKKNPPVFRRSGLIFVGALIAIALCAELFLLDWALERAMVTGLESAFGAEVNVADANLSIIKGEIEINGLQVTDRSKPTHNVLSVTKIHGDIDTRALLDKWFVIDNITVETTLTDTPREAPGKVYETSAEEAPDADAAKEEPENALTQYVQLGKDLSKYRKQLEGIGRFVRNLQLNKQKREDQKREEEQGTYDERLKRKLRNRGYLRVAADDLMPRHPSWTIREFVAADVMLKDKIVDKATLKTMKDAFIVSVRGTELSSNLELSGKPMELSIERRLERTTSGVFSASAKIAFAEEDGRHKVSANLNNMPIYNIIELTDKMPATVPSGNATVTAQGYIGVENIDLDVALRVTNLEVQTREGRKVLGLDPELAREAFETISEITLDVGIEGPVDQPRLKVDTKKIGKQMASSLAKAGKLKLVNRLNMELLKLEGTFSEKVKDSIGDKLPDELKSILPESKKPDDKEAPKSKIEKKIEDMLNLDF